MRIRRRGVAWWGLLACLAAARGAAQDLPRVNDLQRLRGSAFAALGDQAGPSVELGDTVRAEAVRRALAPFGAPWHIGATAIVLGQTGLTERAARWGLATAHGRGEVADRVACWASAAPGVQLAFASVVEAEPPYRLTGWSVAADRLTPAGCTPSRQISPLFPTLALGLMPGIGEAMVEQAVGLPPTWRTPRMLSWFYVLPVRGRGQGWTQTIRLTAIFERAKLAALGYMSLVTD